MGDIFVQGHVSIICKVCVPVLLVTLCIAVSSYEGKDMSLPQSPYQLGSGGSPLVAFDQIYVGHVDLHRPVKICRSKVPFSYI